MIEGVNLPITLPAQLSFQHFQPPAKTLNFQHLYLVKIEKWFLRQIGSKVGSESISASDSALLTRKGIGAMHVMPSIL
jgi:hypothetical protein